MKLPGISQRIITGIAVAAIATHLLTGCASSKGHQANSGSPAFSPQTETEEHAGTRPSPAVPLSPPYTTSGASTQVIPVTVSPAEIPAPETLQRVVDEAYAKFKNDQSGKNADYIPYLAGVPSELFGVVIVTVDGHVYSAGDVNYVFSIQSCSKVFTLAQVIQESGEEAVSKEIGVEPSGMAFNSVTALGLHENRAINPLVNAGAMASVSMVKASSADDRWQKILDYESKFAGEHLDVIQDVYKSEADTNFRNRGIAFILYNGKHLFCDPLEACDVYTKQCSIGVNAHQLAVMGATLANGGVNPITRKRCIDAKHVPRVLAVMTMAGFYDASGEWAYTAGLPGKTGVGGGIVAVVPGRMAIVGFSPRLDDIGNSVRGAKAINYIVQELDLNLFGSVR